MEINEERWDRALRTTLGVIFLILSGTGVVRGAAAWVVGALGLVVLTTGLAGRCLLYSLLGVSTVGEKFGHFHRTHRAGRGSPA